MTTTTPARLGRALRRFFFTPAAPEPLAALRIGVALTLLVQAYLMRREVMNLLAADGYVQGALSRTLADPLAPRLSWLVDYLAQFGVPERACIHGTGIAYLISLTFLAAGLFTRGAAVATWLIHWTLMNTSTITSYGADTYAHVFLFYMMFAPLGAAWSLDGLLGRVAVGPSAAARFIMRVMQLHLCLSYLASGIEKASGSEWWNGELLWRAFQEPIFRQFDMSWLVEWPHLSMLAGWSTLLFELGYCVFIWPRRTRRLWVAAMVGLHLGIAVFLGLGVFGTIMAILTLALFGISAEPRRAGVPPLAPVTGALAAGGA